MTDPAIYSALTGAIVALLLLIQTWAQERRRRIETEAAREKQAEANATKVVEKLSGQRASPVPYPTDPTIRVVDVVAADPVDVTPTETPDAKRGR